MRPARPPVPDGWIGDPEDDHGGICHGDCATKEEIEAWMADLAQPDDQAAQGDDDAV